MATIKAYTDLEQSKKLAKILPIESADMCYGIDDDTLKYNDLPWLIPYHKYTAKKFYTPCWSLTALLNYLREIDFFPNIEADEHSITMNINYYDDEEARMLAPVHDIIVEADTFVDACYNMIIRLRGQNIL